MWYKSIGPLTKVEACHNINMRYEEIKNQIDADFKRLTGVSHATCRKMLAVGRGEYDLLWSPTQTQPSRSTGGSIAPSSTLLKPMV